MSLESQRSKFISLAHCFSNYDDRVCHLGILLTAGSDSGGLGGARGAAFVTELQVVSMLLVLRTAEL